MEKNHLQLFPIPPPNLLVLGKNRPIAWIYPRVSIYQSKGGRRVLDAIYKRERIYKSG
jgi:hypothetical protein